MKTKVNRIKVTVWMTVYFPGQSNMPLCLEAPSYSCLQYTPMNFNTFQVIENHSEYIH